MLVGIHTGVCRASGINRMINGHKLKCFFDSSFTSMPFVHNFFILDYKTSLRYEIWVL